MLTPDEIEGFAVDGYVVRRGVIDPAATARAIEVAWENLPGLDRDDPATWTGSVSDCRGDRVMVDRFGLVKLRHEVSHDPRLEEVTIRNEAILDLGRSLLGPDRLEPPRKFRGIYPIFPTPENAGIPPNAHLDNTPKAFSLVVGVYLNRIPAGGGAINVWPGSHRSLHFASRSTGCEIEDMATPALLEAFLAWNRTEPVELVMGPGDVALFHCRLMHCASANVLPGHVRMACYFNLAMADWTRRPVGRLWDGWDGVRSLGSARVAATEDIPLPAPGPDRASPRRRGLPEGGVFDTFAPKIRKELRRLKELEAA